MTWNGNYWGANVRIHDKASLPEFKRESPVTIVIT